MPQIAVIDPLTLLGREIATEFIRRWPDRDNIVFFHTTDDDEYQVAQIGGQAALVPPLGPDADLADVEAVVLAAEVEGAKLDGLDALLEERTDLLFLDASRIDRYRHLTVPAMDADPTVSDNRLRLAHPSTVVAGILTRALHSLDIRRVSLAAVEPVSVFGTRAVEVLAQQAALRLQGESVEELLDGHLLAFNLACLGGQELTEEANMLLPEFETVATRTIGSCFHGHLTFLDFLLEHPVGQDEIDVCLEASSEVTIVQPPLNLDSVVDRSDIVVTPPSLSSDGRSLTLQAGVDGTRIGGAITAAAIFQGLM